MGIYELELSMKLPKNAHVKHKDADCARARTRCKFLHLKQVAMNVKLRNFALFCLALCLAEKTKSIAKTALPPEIIRSNTRRERWTHVMRPWYFSILHSEGQSKLLSALTLKHTILGKCCTHTSTNLLKVTFF